MYVVVRVTEKTEQHLAEMASCDMNKSEKYTYSAQQTSSMMFQMLHHLLIIYRSTLVCTFSVYMCTAIATIALYKNHK